MSPDPVAWLLIAPGWEVVDSDGELVGTIAGLVGDTERDIFDGLSISSATFESPRYVPSESVGVIVEGRVTLELTAQELQRLHEHGPGGT